MVAAMEASTMSVRGFLACGALFIAACFAPAGSLLAQETGEAAKPPAAAKPAEAVGVPLFKGPVPSVITPPKYPRSEANIGNEGWVHVNFMIDTHGKPYEIAVVESTGNKVFEETAIKAVQQWTFEPAMLGSQPTDAAQDYKLLFTMDTPATSASVQFVGAYRRLSKAVDADDRARADEELAKLRVRNLYEDAFMGIATFFYAQKWGTEEQQLAGLRRAVANEHSPKYLPKSLFVAALNQLMSLQVKVQDLGSALDTWEKLEKVAKKESTARWKDTLDQIEAIRTSDRAHRMSARMEGPSWQGKLLKNRFQLNIASGKVSEIKLRCEKQYVFFKFQPSLEYTVTNNPGRCAIELVGEPGTSFELIQS
jgi:TonB family protein